MLRLGTHVVSAILNVGQKVDRDWPLHIQDNQGNHHQVFTMQHDNADDDNDDEDDDNDDNDDEAGNDINLYWPFQNKRNQNF